MKGKRLTLSFNTDVPNLLFFVFKVKDNNVIGHYFQRFGKIEISPLTCTHQFDTVTYFYIKKMKADTRRHLLYLPCKNTTY